MPSDTTFSPSPSQAASQAVRTQTSPLLHLSTIHPSILLSITLPLAYTHTHTHTHIHTHTQLPAVLAAWVQREVGWGPTKGDKPRERGRREKEDDQL